MSAHKTQNAGRHLIRKTLMVLAVPAAAFGCAFGLSLVGIPVTGFEHDADQAVKKAEPVATVRTVAARTTAAQTSLEQIMDTADGAWKKAGSRITAAGLPHPLSCVKPAPSLSLSQLYDVPERGSAQVTVTSYAAGVGAKAFDRLVNKVDDCKQANVSLAAVPQDIIGTEAARMQTSWSGNSVTTVLWRRGDVIAFVATQTRNSANASSIAKSVDRVMSAELGKCADQQSTVNDALRNAFHAGKNFTGKRDTKDVTAVKAQKPVLTAEQESAGVKPFVRGKELDVPEVHRPVQPVAYPVWPDLPKIVTEPTFPERPKPQNLSATVDIRVADPTGPGCGWDFMASSVASFDAAQVQADNDERIDAAQALLDADVKRWTTETSAYYSAYAKYTKDVTDFASYAKAVADVAVAWSKIADEWADYYADYADWEQTEAERDDLIVDIKDAQNGYDDAIARCDELAASIRVEDIAEFAGTCPPVGPEVLDADVPKPTKAPAKPKDPRP